MFTKIARRILINMVLAGIALIIIGQSMPREVGGFGGYVSPQLPSETLEQRLEREKVEAYARVVKATKQAEADVFAKNTDCRRRKLPRRVPTAFLVRWSEGERVFAERETWEEIVAGKRSPHGWIIGFCY